jgi:Domain of unknown function (DUF4177)
MKKRFEYKILSGMNKQKWYQSFTKEEELLKQLNKSGEDGWEIIQTIHTVIFIRLFLKEKFNIMKC